MRLADTFNRDGWTSRGDDGTERRHPTVDGVALVDFSSKRFVKSVVYAYRLTFSYMNERQRDPN